MAYNAPLDDLVARDMGARTDMHTPEAINPTGQSSAQNAGISRLSPMLVSTTFVVSISMILVLFYAELRHWFMLPIGVCGAMIGRDAVRWFRGEFDLADIRGIIGVLGVHFFWSSAWMIPIVGVQPFRSAGVTALDFRPYLGVLGLLNIVGIFLYQLFSNWIVSRPCRKPVKVRRTSPGRTGLVLFIAVVAGIAGAAYMITTVGISVKTDFGDDGIIVQGAGVPVLLRTTLPITLAFAAMCWHLAFSKNNKKSVLAVLILLGLMTFCSLVLNGLGGNRSSTLLVVFWVGGMIHFLWRPFRRHEAVVIGCLLVLFSFVYIFYKFYGTTGFKAFLNEGVEAAQSTGADKVERGFTGMLVGDFSRSHLQGYAVFVLLDKPYPYRLRFGRTIEGDFLNVVPRWIYLSKYNHLGYSGKHEAGTDLIRGPNKFDPQEHGGKEPRTWGIGGYMMLNFGLYGLPFGYALLGIFVGWSQRTANIWRATGDLRLLLAPMFLIIAIFMLMMDAYVLFIFTLRFFLLPTIVVYLATQVIGRYQVPQVQSS